MKPKVSFKIAGQDLTGERYRSCRRMLVGPWCNQPEEYEGYNGFVGWAGVTPLRSGRWLLTFTSGYWHASPPWTEEIRKDPECRKQFEEWQKVGMPNIRAPRGGRAHIMHSDDKGLTWSKPETLIDTEHDDRHPTIIELDDGRLLCTYFSSSLHRDARSWYMRSTDGGQTWSKPQKFPGESGGFGNGSAIQLSDGTVLCTAGGESEPGTDKERLNICRSTDRGASFELVSVLHGGAGGMSESPIAELPDGKIIIISRRSSPIYFSEDGGRNWTEPVFIGVDLYDPHLVLAPGGVLACFHGSYKTGGLRVILSPDGGRTWHGPEEGLGYAVDTSVYGYSHQMVLPDGSIYCVYIHTGGHHAYDARTQALWAIRLKVHSNAEGIDILPAPGSPADRGDSVSALESMPTEGGDPELGNL